MATHLGRPDARRRRRARRIGSGVVVCAVLLVAAACSSTDSASDDTSSPVGTDTAGTSAPATPAAGAPVPSPGCDGTATAGGAVTEEERTIDVDGTERWYLLTTPESNDGTTPLPVVFDWHGLMEGAAVHATMSQYSALAAEEGFVAVFPNGQGEPVRWDANPQNEPNADLAFFDF